MINHKVQIPPVMCGDPWCPCKNSKCFSMTSTVDGAGVQHYLLLLSKLPCLLPPSPPFSRGCSEGSMRENEQVAHPFFNGMAVLLQCRLSSSSPLTDSSHLHTVSCQSLHSFMTLFVCSPRSLFIFLFA
ncbi:hypothetical protein JOB18_021408 [Solea senegalensis]|uniref:Uncharacterized protein n=1 Tax=Solea senegalensis TaxID=28829 RepID=A0AAV6QBV1_SOLSE|nr:hypothetical protein JOB18_021408 [Solea senegalensis]